MWRLPVFYYTPLPANKMSVDELNQTFFTLKDEHDVFRKAFLKEFSEKAMQAFMADPLSVCVNYPDKTREESLAITWHENKRRMQESLAEKASRMADAANICLRESNFQEQHAKVETVFEGQILCGYYKVQRTSTHYEFVLIRTNIPDEDVPSKVILPLSTVMGEGPWQDVTPSKITMLDDEPEGLSLDDDDIPCHFCGCRLEECLEDGDHSEEMRYLEREHGGRRHWHE